MPRATLSKTAIARRLETSPLPAFLVDERRKIIYANQSLADWLAIEKESLAGKRCDYHTESKAASELAISGLCPPPSAFDGIPGEGEIHRISCGKEVDTVSHSVFFWPLKDVHDRVTGVLVLGVAEGTQASSNRFIPGHRPEELHAALARLRASYFDHFSLDRLVGESATIQRVREQVTVATNCTARVLVAGSPGSGCARIARMIHSARVGNPALIPLDCAVNDAESLRDTLTAFIRRYAELDTDAPPSLMLANVDKLGIEAQKELEGFLAIDELGLRTLAVSNVSYEQLMSQGFRPDLGTRLSAILIDVPPLATRRNDIPQLVQAIVEQHNAEGGSQLMGFEEEAIEQLIAYPWPGNEDELERVVRKCASQATSSFILANELPCEIRLGMDAVLNPVVEPAWPPLHFQTSPCRPGRNYLCVPIRAPTPSFQRAPARYLSGRTD